MRRVVEPLLSGGEVRHDGRGLEYVRDLGLLAPDSPPRMANPIYAEVVPRELGYVLQDSLDVQAAWYVDGDGRLDMTKLLTAFDTFFGAHSEHWLGRFSEYPEAGPQLVLQSYLHRVVNGGGRIKREYGLGADGRTCWCCGRARRGSRRACGSVSWSSARCCATRIGLHPGYRRHGRVRHRADQDRRRGLADGHGRQRLAARRGATTCWPAGRAGTGSKETKAPTVCSAAGMRTRSSAGPATTRSASTPGSAAGTSSATTGTATT